jgi:hypothetical protein
MENFIRKIFLHVENVGSHVLAGHYDLISPEGEIILPQVWEQTIKPDWKISMHMWPPQTVQPAPLHRNGHRPRKVFYDSPSSQRTGPPPPPPPGSPPPPGPPRLRPGVPEGSSRPLRSSMRGIDVPGVVGGWPPGTIPVQLHKTSRKGNFVTEMLLDLVT